MAAEDRYHRYDSDCKSARSQSIDMVVPDEVAHAQREEHRKRSLFVFVSFVEATHSQPQYPGNSLGKKKAYGWEQRKIIQSKLLMHFSLSSRFKRRHHVHHNDAAQSGNRVTDYECSVNGHFLRMRPIWPIAPVSIIARCDYNISIGRRNGWRVHSGWYALHWVTHCVGLNWSKLRVMEREMVLVGRNDQEMRSLKSRYSLSSLRSLECRCKYGWGVVFMVNVVGQLYARIIKDCHMI